MTKWHKDTSTFRVKLSYKPGKTRATIALPAPILYAWGYPEYIQFSGDNGIVIVKPVRSDVNTSMTN